MATNIVFTKLRPAAKPDQPDGMSRTPRSNSKSGSELYRPVERTGVTELVIERIKQMLANGELQAGSRLPPERELAQLLKISRPSLRTALKALSVIGIVSSRPGAGTYIVESPKSSFREPVHFLTLHHQTGYAELFEVRRMLESSLAGLAAERISKQELSVMAEDLEAMRDAVNDPVSFARHDFSFHETISQASRNQVMSGVLATITQMLAPARRQTIDRATRRDFSETIACHERLYQALVKQNAALAKSVMADHLHASEQVWLR